MDKQQTYIAIDLKSFYASVECVYRKLDPMTTNLVVADESRTEKTICLAVSPALKQYGIPGRARLFEVVQRLEEVNARRKQRAGALTGSSWDDRELRKNSSLAVDYLIAKPRMARYMEQSGKIYEIYLKYVAPEDIHVYSIDEVFINATPYLKASGKDGPGFARMLIQDVLESTGITATAGIGTNLYLCKVAMDIVAKKTAPDENGVRMAQLNELSYRKLLWNHRPLTDFWRIGPGYAKKLERYGMYTMGDVARCSLGQPGQYQNEDLLYRLFGVNAELLIDHAWGYEPCTIEDIKAYRPENNSISSGQVLSRPTEYGTAGLILREMAESVSLDLVRRSALTDRITITIGYDVDNLRDEHRRRAYTGPTVTDGHGRRIPKHSQGTASLPEKTASTREIMRIVAELFEKTADPNLLIRRMTVDCSVKPRETGPCQLSLFSDSGALSREQEERECRRQQAVLEIKDRFGKNAILRGMNLEEGATARERNGQIGGHKA